MKQLDTLSLSDAKNLLKDMRIYADMTKKLWSRGRALFAKTLSGAKTCNVEYFPNLGEDSAWAQAQNVFKKSFSYDVKREEVTFVENPDLKGGMKVYLDDEMVDLSYKKVENLMQR